MNTIETSQWNELCAMQLQRAKGGDQRAAEWCAKHKPSLDPSRPMHGDTGEITSLVSKWRELLCLPCRKKLLEQLEREADEQAAPDAEQAAQRQAQARKHVAEAYDLAEPPVENDPAG